MRSEQLLSEQLLNAIDGAHYVFRGVAAANAIASEYNYLHGRLWPAGNRQGREGDTKVVRLLFVWHGGTLINIYSESGDCVHAFTLAKESTQDNPGGYPSRREVHDSIVDHLKALQLPED